MIHRELQQIQERHQRAAPTPVTIYGRGNHLVTGHQVQSHDEPGREMVFSARSDAEFFTQCHADIGDLLAHVAAMEKRLSQLEMIEWQEKGG